MLFILQIMYLLQGNSKKQDFECRKPPPKLPALLRILKVCSLSNYQSNYDFLF